MTSAEFTDWVAYSEISGPINYRRRYDQPAALLAWITQGVQGGKAAMADFLPNFDIPDEPTDGFSSVDRQLLAALKQSGQNRFE